MVGAVLQWHILSINKNPNLVPGISLILEILIVFLKQESTTSVKIDQIKTKRSDY